MENANRNNKQIQTLVVEDDPLNRKLIIAFLTKLNCKNDIAVNGEEAVAKTRDHRYDICFMDIQMPIMGGVEATQIIRSEITKNMPIIAVTAVLDFNREKSLEAGMNDYLKKPVDLARLKETLSKYFPQSH